MHGILRGYRVLYKKTNEPSAPYTKITVSPGVRMKEIYGLKKFTYYTIRVLAFTIKGDGVKSPPVNVSTDEDSKYITWWTKPLFSQFSGRFFMVPVCLNVTGFLKFR